MSHENLIDGVEAWEATKGNFLGRLSGRKVRWNADKSAMLVDGGGVLTHREAQMVSEMVFTRTMWRYDDEHGAYWQTVEAHNADVHGV